jgi:hypothetical protein
MPFFVNILLIFCLCLFVVFVKILNFFCYVVD